MKRLASHREDDVSKEERTAYWGTVEDCLVRFHCHPKPTAHGKTNALRRRMDNPPSTTSQLIYHQEPFYIACEIAGIHEVGEQERLLTRHSREYDMIKEERGW